MRCTRLKRRRKLSPRSIDLGKTTFRSVGLEKRGAIVLQQKISRSQFERRPSAADRLRPARSHHIGRQWTALGHEVRRIQEQLRVDARSSMINGQPTRSFGYGRNFGKLAGSRRWARPGQRGSIAAHRATNSKNEEQMWCEGRDRHVALKGEGAYLAANASGAYPRRAPCHPIDPLTESIHSVSSAIVAQAQPDAGR